MRSPSTLVLPLLATALLAGCTEEPATCDLPLEARARGDGSVFLDWQPMPGAVSHRIERQAGDGPNQENYGGTVEPMTNFTDGGLEPDVTYRYRILGYDRSGGPVGCAEASVTAIPHFPNALAAGLALVGGVGAFVALRRRR